MVSRCRLNLVIYLISFIFGRCATTEPFCSATVFGVPPWDDCIAAFSRIPFAGDYVTSRNADSFHLYSEPQYLSPPFRQVYNRYQPRPIIQIPKIWQFNRCRVALISYTDGPDRGVNPLFGASWKQILIRLELVKQCIRPVEGGTAAGGWIPFTSQVTTETAAALYMYSVDSPFVNYVNSYMITGRAIKPPIFESQLLSLLASNSSITNQSVTPSSSAPSIAMNVTFLDGTN